MREQAQERHATPSHDAHGRTPTLGTCLQLSPPSLEREFWQSRPRLLRALDFVGLCNSTLFNVLLLRKFGLADRTPGMGWHHGMCILYLCTGLLQLGLLMAAPQWHQRHRFRLTLANRLVKLFTFTWVALEMSNPAIVDRMSRTFNNEDGSMDSWSSSTEPTSSSSDGAGGNLGHFLNLLRPIAVPPLIWLSHAVNFVLPFYLVLPMQLYTLAVSLLIVRPTACMVWAMEGNMRWAGQACLWLKQTMYAATLVLGMPPQKPPANELGCQGVASALWLVLVTYVMLLLVVPCVGIYLVELSLKLGFLKERQMKVRYALPQEDMAKGLVAYTLVIFSGLMCEALVGAVSPVTCNSNGLLVWRSAFQASAAPGVAGNGTLRFANALY